jgi:hypothetical protein
MTETRSLHRKLAQIMYEAERIPKNGRAPDAMGGFPFVQVGDAADFIRKALADKIITMMPTAVRIISQTDRPTKSGGSMTTVDLITDWTITDGESGESIVIQSFGAGADGGDKYSGKAQTNAMKYALLMGFLLSTGDEPEMEYHEPASRPRQTARTAPAPVRATESAPVATAAPKDHDPSDPSWGIEQDEAFDALVTGNTQAMRPAETSVPTCPKHNVPWKGEPGDLYHKLESGGYCRPEGQPRKAR